MKKLELAKLETIKDYQQYSYAELGKLLSVNEKTVRNLYKRSGLEKQQVRIRSRELRKEIS